MKTLYAVRHRVAGIVSTHLYEKHPTPEQLAERKAEADEIWGCPGLRDEALVKERAAGCPSNWVKVEEVKLVEGDELDPYVPPRNEVSSPQEVGVPKLRMEGHVGPALEIVVKADEVLEISGNQFHEGLQGLPPSDVSTLPEVPSKKRR